MPVRGDCRASEAVSWIRGAERREARSRTRWTGRMPVRGDCRASEAVSWIRGAERREARSRTRLLAKSRPKTTVTESPGVVGRLSHGPNRDRFDLQMWPDGRLMWVKRDHGVP